jgi:hypothetical protein
LGWRIIHSYSLPHRNPAKTGDASFASTPVNFVCSLGKSISACVRLGRYKLASRELVQFV